MTTNMVCNADTHSYVHRYYWTSETRRDCIFSDDVSPILWLDCTIGTPSIQQFSFLARSAQSEIQMDRQGLQVYTHHKHIHPYGHTHQHTHRQTDNCFTYECKKVCLSYALVPLITDIHILGTNNNEPNHGGAQADAAGASMKNALWAWTLKYSKPIQQARCAKCEHSWLNWINIIDVCSSHSINVCGDRVTR